MVRKLMSQVVKRFRYTRTEAEDGEEAVEAVRKALDEGLMYDDVILMDNQMPKMMGGEAARIIRNELKYEGTIIGITANLMDEDINDFIANGADKVMKKPLTKDKFKEHVVSLLFRIVCKAPQIALVSR